MKIELKRGDVYTPKWSGNEEDAEPIRVHFHFVTVGERSAFQGVEPVTFDRDGQPIVTLRQDDAGLARTMIDRIENLEVVVTGKAIVIDDAKKLYGTQGVPPEMVKEIEVALKTANPVISADPLE